MNPLNTEECILFVDDDEDLREICCELLGEAGYRVRAAAHGGEALELMPVLKPRVVFLDLMMPGVSGWDFLKLVASDEALARTPIVVLTAFSHVRPSEFGPQVVRVLKKPLAMEALVAAATEALSMSGANASTDACSASSVA